MTLVLRWRVPAPVITKRWRGPNGMFDAVEHNLIQPIAAIIGPQGPIGPAGHPIQINASLNASWILSHSLGRIPVVHVYLSSGEKVIADVTATTNQISVTFPTPQAGYVLIY